MEEKKTNSKGVIIVVAVFIVLIVGMIAAYSVLSDKTVEGDKTVIVEVILNNGKSQSYTIKTDEEYLRAAIDADGQIKLEGEDSEFGLFIKAVNGFTVSDDPTAQEWWCITKNGETHMMGIDTTVIADGEKYEITLKVGYDEF
jgi:hypothetical protein